VICVGSFIFCLFIFCNGCRGSAYFLTIWTELEAPTLVTLHLTAVICCKLSSRQMVCGFVIKRLDVPAAKRHKLSENVPRGLGKGPTWPTNSNLCARTTQHSRIQRFVHVHSKRRKRESGSEAGLDSIRPTVCCRPKEHPPGHDAS
jgi:hypothetical protein